ncbi:MAG: PTS sugar transporter subunit IIA [Phycisphaerales bacterium]|nr:PTS sugar transporter subunit IIA [Phycisphaerales bacterium]
MNLSSILTVECIQAPLEASEKQEAINELVDLLAKNDKVKDPESLKDAVWSREQTRTTGIGHGLAIPHGKCDCIQNPTLAIGRPSSPMDFESMDSQPVELIVLLASPTSSTREHIEALAQVSRIMNNPSFREVIYKADDAEEIYNLLVEQGG